MSGITGYGGGDGRTHMFTGDDGAPIYMPRNPSTDALAKQFQASAKAAAAPPVDPVTAQIAAGLQGYNPMGPGSAPPPMGGAPAPSRDQDMRVRSVPHSALQAAPTQAAQSPMQPASGGVPARWSKRVPEHDQELGRVIKPGLQLDPNVFGKEARTDQLINDKLRAQSQGDANQSRLFGEYVGQQKEHADLASAQEQQHQRALAVQAEFKRRETERAKIKEAIDSTEIDPKRIFRDSPVKGFMAAIAAGMGAYASGMNGGPNFALQVLDKAVERDINAQKSELAKKRGQLGEVTNGLADLRAAGYSPEMAEKQLKQIGRQVALNEARQLQTTSAALQADANVNATLAGLEKQFQAGEIELAKLTQDDVTIKQAHVPERVVSGGPATKPLFDEELEYRRIKNLTLEQQAELAGSKANRSDLIKYNTQNAKFNAVSSALRNLKRLHADAATRQDTGDPDLPGKGAGHVALQGIPGVGDALSRAAGGHHGRELQVAEDTAVELVTTFITGAASTPEQKIVFQNMLGVGSAYEGDSRTGLTNLEVLVEDEQRNKLRGFSPTIRALSRINAPATKGALADPTGVVEMAR